MYYVDIFRMTFDPEQLLVLPEPYCHQLGLF